MRFIDYIGFGKAAKKQQRIEETQNVYLVTGNEIHGSPPDARATNLAQIYVTNPWARTIVSKIANGVAHQKWYIEKPGAKEPDFKHEAVQFLRRGCKGLRGRKGFAVTQTLLELQGECFWIIGRNGSGQAVEWAPVPSHWVLDTPNKTSSKFRIQPRSGVTLELEGADVIHFRDPNPVDPYERGTSIAKAAWADLQADKAASDALLSFFTNDMRPALAVTGADCPLSDKDMARAEETWMSKFRGPNRKGRPWFSANKVEIKEIGSGLRENAVPETRNMLRDNALQAWGLPPESIGILSKSNRSTIDSADLFLAKNLINPRLMFLLDELEPFCIDEFGIEPDTLKYESPIAEDVTQALEFVKARSTAFTDNEVRRWAKLKPAPGKDEFPEAPDPNAMGPGNGPNGKPKPNDDGKTFALGVEKILSVDEVVSVSAAHEDPQVRAQVDAMFTEIYAKLVERFGTDLLKTLEAEADFEITGAATEFVAREVPELIGQIDATTRKELAASLAEGSARNEDVAQLIKRVEAVFAEAGKARASMIGDTVATKIAGYTTQLAGRQAGFSRKKWLSTRDHKVRDTHLALDRQVRRMDEPFQSPSGARAMHPGAFGKAAEDINCRCAMRPVLEGEKSAALSDVEYEAKYEALREGLAGRFERVAKDVFRGQKAVVLEALKRATATRSPFYVN